MSELYEIRGDEHGIGDVLILRGPWSESIRRVMMRNSIEALRLSYSMCWRCKNVEFVADLGFLRSLEVWSHEVTDVQAAMSLPRLEVLGLEVKRTGPLDFLKLRRLRVALLTWTRAMEGVLTCEAIQYLSIVNFPFTDLIPLARLARLRVLKLTSRKIESLEGIEVLRSLESLDLYNCPSLESLAPSSRCRSLKRVEVEACRHIGKGRIIEVRDA